MAPWHTTCILGIATRTLGITDTGINSELWQSNFELCDRILSSSSKTLWLCGWNVLFPPVVRLWWYSCGKMIDSFCCFAVCYFFSTILHLLFAHYLFLLFDTCCPVFSDHIYNRTDSRLYPKTIWWQNHPSHTNYCTVSNYACSLPDRRQLDKADSLT